MKKINETFWKTLSCVLAIIILVLVFALVKTPKKEKEKQSKNNLEAEENIEESDITRNIRIDEDISKDGRIENLEHVIWNDASILQYDNRLEVNINLESELEEENIPSKELKIALYEKSGKLITEQKIKMEEIKAPYGHTNLKFEVEVNEPTIVYDMEISVE